MEAYKIVAAVVCAFACFWCIKERMWAGAIANAAAILALAA